MVTLRIATLLVGVSCIVFFGGAYFPLAVALDQAPSVLVYGIILVSVPAWIAGAVSGALAGSILARTGCSAPRLRRTAWLLAGANLIAIMVVAFWNPPGVS